MTISDTTTITISGKQVSIRGGKATVDGEEYAIEGVSLTVVILGDVNVLDVEACSTSEITGSAGKVKSMSGQITCNNVEGDASTMSGNIICQTLHGSASTLSGNEVHRTPHKHETAE